MPLLIDKMLDLKLQSAMHANFKIYVNTYVGENNLPDSNLLDELITNYALKCLVQSKFGILSEEGESQCPFENRNIYVQLTLAEARRRSPTETSALVNVKNDVFLQNLTNEFRSLLKPFIDELSLAHSLQINTQLSPDKEQKSTDLFTHLPIARQLSSLQHEIGKTQRNIRALKLNIQREKISTNDETVVGLYEIGLNEAIDRLKSITSQHDRLSQLLNPDSPTRKPFDTGRQFLTKKGLFTAPSSKESYGKTREHRPRAKIKPF